ncbi:MAG TPA: GspMb/PilO family protein [Bryobacteraceae bacterium]|nr:GspMb/PilO family protein [Bryobacteraceae bacterium]
MTLTTRDRRALAGLGVAVVGVAIYLLSSSSSGAPEVISASDTIPSAERRLAQARRLAASVPGKQQLLKQVSNELAGREKAILQAQTAAQAQARLLDIARRVGKAQAPPLDFGTVELGQEVKQLGDYGQVEITVGFNCRMEELVNFLADLTRQPEAVSTADLRVVAADAKQKTVTARVTVVGLVPQRLVPPKKGLGAL